LPVSSEACAGIRDSSSVLPVHGANLRNVPPSSAGSAGIQAHRYRACDIGGPVLPGRTPPLEGRPTGCSGPRRCGRPG
jgi:hypothetical protein